MKATKQGSDSHSRPKLGFILGIVLKQLALKRYKSVSSHMNITHRTKKKKKKKKKKIGLVTGKPEFEAGGLL